MKKALICGAGGFIGGHLVKKLKKEGCWVRGVDIKEHEFAETQGDEFLLLDLREAHNCWEALNLGDGETFDEVYQLAADMGGMGFIHSAECDIMQQRVDQHQYDRHGSEDRRAALFLLFFRLCVPRYAAG